MWFSWKIIFFIIDCIEGYYGKNCSMLCSSKCTKCRHTDGVCICKKCMILGKKILILKNISMSVRFRTKSPHCFFLDRFLSKTVELINHHLKLWARLSMIQINHQNILKFITNSLPLSPFYLMLSKLRLTYSEISQIRHT